MERPRATLSRRQVLSLTAVTTGVGSFAGCIGGETASASDSDDTTAQSSFFVFGDLTAQVAGRVASAELLVPIGQHGHGWEPGPSIREDIRGADLLVHGMAGFQPWIDSIRTDLEVDKPDVIAVDASAGVDLLAVGDDDDHEGDDDDEDEDEDETTRGPGMDPHFWMDPVRVEAATDTIRQGLADADPGNADEYADNAAAFQDRLQSLHGRLQRLVDAASTDVLLVAGHDSLQYVGDRYGVTIESLTNVSPDDRPTPRDIEQARQVIETHGLQYICADPLESQRAADQLVRETAAEEVLPLTAMPGLADEWAQNDWGYVEVMENVNIPTLERALDAV